MSTPPTNLDFLLTNLTTEVADISHALAISADGLTLARSHNLPHDRADQLAAIAAGLTSLTHGAADLMHAGAVQQTIVEMDAGFLFLMTIDGKGALVTLAQRNCDVGHIGYAMALHVENIGALITPQTRPSDPTPTSR